MNKQTTFRVRTEGSILEMTLDEVAEGARAPRDLVSRRLARGERELANLRASAAEGRARRIAQGRRENGSIYAEARLTKDLPFARGMMAPSQWRALQRKS